MKKFEGRKIKDLTERELGELRSKVSGYYTNENIQGIGSWEITLDFEDGTSVAGTLTRTEDEEVIEFNDDAIIYNPIVEVEQEKYND